MSFKEGKPRHIDVHVRGILLLDRGQVLNTLTITTAEVRALLAYYCKPLDGFTVQIVDWARFDEPQSLHHVRRRDPDRSGSHSYGLGDDIAVTLKSQYVFMSSSSEIDMEQMCSTRTGRRMQPGMFLRKCGVPCMDTASVP